MIITIANILLQVIGLTNFLFLKNSSLRANPSDIRSIPKISKFEGSDSKYTEYFETQDFIRFCFLLFKICFFSFLIFLTYISQPLFILDIFNIHLHSNLVFKLEVTSMPEYLNILNGFHYEDIMNGICISILIIFPLTFLTFFSFVILLSFVIVSSSATDLIWCQIVLFKCFKITYHLLVIIYLVIIYYIIESLFLRVGLSSYAEQTQYIFKIYTFLYSLFFILEYYFWSNTFFEKQKISKIYLKLKSPFFIRLEFKNVPVYFYSRYYHLVDSYETCIDSYKTDPWYFRFLRENNLPNKFPNRTDIDFCYSDDFIHYCEYVNYIIKLNAPPKTKLFSIF